MKKQFFSLVCATALFGFVACNDGDTETSSSDSTSTTTTTTSDATMDSYVDLSTGQPVQLDVNAETRVATPRTQGTVVRYYVNRSTNDTIEASTGRILNGALIHLDTGDWSVDEAKVKTDEDGTKIKTDGTKIKDKDGKYKEKTDSTKLKIKDGKVKVKTDTTGR
jgi:hypothetical protein